MKVTRGDPAGAIHFKPFAQWELHDGAASDDSVKTEALPANADGARSMPSAPLPPSDDPTARPLATAAFHDLLPLPHHTPFTQHQHSPVPHPPYPE